MNPNQDFSHEDFTARPANRIRRFAQVALCGPSGSGKSWSALLLAQGLAGPNGKVIAIDAGEHDAMGEYHYLYPFDVISLQDNYHPNRYIAALRAAVQQGADVVILDSATHEWTGEGGILDIKTRMPLPANRNEFSKWDTLTPLHQRFITELQSMPCHLIVTLRAKTEWTEGERNGRKTFIKSGIGPIQRDGIEYEFNTYLSLTHEHVALVERDRTHVFKEDAYELILPAHGERMREWLLSGKPFDMEAGEPASATFPPPRREDTVAPASVLESPTPAPVPQPAPVAAAAEPAPVPSVHEAQTAKEAQIGAEMDALSRKAIQCGYASLEEACAMMRYKMPKLLSTGSYRRTMAADFNERIRERQAKIPASASA